MSCLRPLSIRNPLWLKGGKCDEWMIVPCGKCPGCLIDKRNEWTSRIECEVHSNLFTYFFTLTYDEIHEPWVFDETSGCSFPSVSKRDVQLFLKRLRKRFDSVFGYRFRYVLVSEYGPKSYRPHYHGLLFTDFGDCRRVEDAIARCWRKGRIDASLYTGGASAYCSKYLFKRQPDGISAFTPSFLLSSRRPPIGLSYFTPRMVEYFRKQLTTKYRDINGVERSLPRIFRDKFFSEEEKELMREKRVSEYLDNLCRKLKLSRDDVELTTKIIDRLNAARGGNWSLLNKKIQNICNKSSRI